MTPSLPAHHSIDYRGFTIHYAAGEYYVAGWPKKKYASMTEAKAFVDKIDESDNYQKTKTRPQ